MAEDPYKLLGLPRSASDDDVRRAFRKLAKELHPDARPNDNAAAERFKQVSQAYEMLGDADKRRRYDSGEIDAGGEPRRAYSSAGAGPFSGAARPGTRGPADDFGFGDIFENLFRGGAGAGGPGGPGAAGGAGFTPRPIRGQDARYTLEVDFLEAGAGARKRVTLPGGDVLDINVPEGVGDRQVLRLKGKGHAGLRGGEAGDALVEIRVRPHADMRRDGDDIQTTLPISLDEAVLGAKIEVETLSGRVQLSIPKATSSGRVFRLRGKGARNTNTGQTGDHLVTVQIVLPEVIDESLAYFISEWKGRYPYNPRKKG